MNIYFIFKESIGKCIYNKLNLTQKKYFITMMMMFLIFVIRKNYKVPCQQIISKLFWLQDEIHSPCDYIQPAITSYGFCYSLNVIPYRHFYEKHYFQTYVFNNRT